MNAHQLCKLALTLVEQGNLDDAWHALRSLEYALVGQAVVPVNPTPDILSKFIGQPVNTITPSRRNSETERYKEMLNGTPG